METRHSAPDQLLQEEGMDKTFHLEGSGTLDVMRVTRNVYSTAGSLLFVGTPVRAGSKARSLLVSFCPNGEPPAPTLDSRNGQVHLHYPHRDHPEVQALLNGKRKRFCYFWRSAKWGHTRAWVISSR